MTLIRRGSAKKKHEARLAWLSARPALYVGVPGINEDVTDAGRLRPQHCGTISETFPKYFGRTSVRPARGRARNG